MTYHPDRRHLPRRSSRVWPGYIRCAYRAISRPWGLFFARIVWGLIIFSLILGGVLYWTIKQIESDKIEVLERQIEQSEQETSRRLNRVEEAISP